MAPLSGIRVLEVGRFASAPSCATVLADWGADVVKLEPLTGDPARGPGSWDKAGRPNRPANPRFDVHNRSRRSLALNLKAPPGQEVADRLLAETDVLVTNLRRSTLPALGLESVEVRARHPHLIFAQVTGYGPGDDRHLRSYDHGAFWSYSGLASLFRNAQGQPPQPAGGLGDRASGLALSGAVCAALLARERSGAGDHVEVSLLGTAFWLMASDVADALERPDHERLISREQAPIPTVNCFRCADGRWFWLQVMLAERDWPALVKALDADWLNDVPRFEGGSSAGLRQARAELVEALDEIFRRRPYAEWARRLDDAGLTHAPVHDLREAVHDPLAQASGSFREVAVGDDARFHTVESPAFFASAGARTGTPAPAIGADTGQILCDLGYSTSEIEALVADGVCAD